MEKKKQQAKGEKSQCEKSGKQSIKSLQKSGAQITNIVVTDNNIKSFDRVARKYGIDYSLKKVEQEGKTEYLVFFKARDVDVMTAAFKEYTSETLKKQKRESVRQKLEKVKEELSNHRQLKKRKEEGTGTDTMKNPKTPTQRPRKAPSNQTGGTAWGKKNGCRVQQDGAGSRYEKADPVEFSVHHRLLHGGKGRMALPSLQWRYRGGQAHGSFHKLWSGLQKCLAQFLPIRPDGRAGRRSCAESSDLLQREEREEVSARRGVRLCPVGQPEGHRTFY